MMTLDKAPIKAVFEANSNVSDQRVDEKLRTNHQIS